MVDSYLSTKFGINSLDGSEKTFYGRQMDARATAIALLTESSRAKNMQQNV